MNLSNVLILPTLKLHELEVQVEIKCADKKKYTNVERSDALESLGIAQFYNGDYADAISNLEGSIAPRYVKLKSKKRVAVVKTLLGSLYYRFGDLQRSELLFSSAGETCKKIHDPTMLSITLSNMAIVQMRQENSKDALKNAKGAVDVLQKIYSKKCAEYLQAVRVLICIYLKLEEFSKAEDLVEEHDFPPREKALVLAGIHFAQCQYSAAQAVLLKCIETESKPAAPPAAITTPRGKALTPVKPSFERQPSSQSAAELVYNPWSKWGGKEGGKEGKDSPLGGEKASAPLIQPKSSYMDSVNDEIMGNMITYNLSILKSKSVSDIGISHTIEKLERFKKQLAERRVQVITKALRTQTIHKSYENGIGPLSQDDPYLHLNCDQHPNYMPFDAFMYPGVALSVMLSAQSEFDMLTGVFGSGMAIESGHISGDVTGLDTSLRQIQQEFKSALFAIQSSLPASVDAKSGAQTFAHVKNWAEDALTGDYSQPATSRSSAPGTARTSRRGSTQDLLSRVSTPNTGRASSTFSFEDSEVSGDGHSATQSQSKLLAPIQLTAAMLQEFEEIPDLKQAKYNIQQFQILTDLVNKQVGNHELADSALKRLREEHHVFLHAHNGKLFTGKEIDALLHPKPVRPNSKAGKKTGTSETAAATTTTLTNTTSSFDATRPSSPESMTARSELGDNQEDQVTKSNAEAAASEALAALATVAYNGSKLAGGTLQGDMLPLAPTFGKDQATLWIEWALSKTGAMSFGFLGQSCMDPLPSVGFDLIKPKSAPPTPAAGDTRADAAAGDVSNEFLVQVRSRLLDLETVLSTPNENSKLTARGVRLEARVIVYLLLCKITVQLDLKKEAGQCVLQLEDVCLSLRKQQCDSLDSLVYHTFAMRFRLDYEEWCISPNASDAWMLTHLVQKVLISSKQYVTLCKLTGDIFLQRDALKRLINVYSEIGSIPMADSTDVASLTKEKVARMSVSELDNYERNVDWVQKNGSHRAIILYEEMHKLAANVTM